MDESESYSGPRCGRCGRPLTRQHTGVLSMSASSLCPDCERSA